MHKLRALGSTLGAVSPGKNAPPPKNTNRYIRYIRHVEHGHEIEIGGESAYVCVILAVVVYVAHLT